MEILQIILHNACSMQHGNTFGGFLTCHSTVQNTAIKDFKGVPHCHCCRLMQPVVSVGPTSRSGPSAIAWLAYPIAASLRALFRIYNPFHAHSPLCQNLKSNKVKEL